MRMRRKMWIQIAVKRYAESQMAKRPYRPLWLVSKTNSGNIRRDQRSN
jgi:hypothetical protein